ncbi:helix-turn-helix domain-containing protein [Paenibacillus sp. CMAA1364]
MIKCNLAVLMAERKLSIQDVADNTGLSRTTISALVNENGKGVQFETMDTLCELLKVTPGELFSYVLIKVDIFIDQVEESEEEVLYGDEEGNPGVIEKDFNLTMTINIRCEDSVFSDSIFITIPSSFDDINGSAHYEYAIDDIQLTSYLQKLPYYHRERIKDAIEQYLFEIFIVGLPEFKNAQASFITPKWSV